MLKTFLTLKTFQYRILTLGSIFNIKLWSLGLVVNGVQINVTPAVDRIYASLTYSKGQFYVGFTASQDYFTHFEPSQSLDGAKTGDPREHHLTTRKQNLACLTCASS